MAEEWVVNSQQSKEAFLKHMEELYDQHKYVTFTWKTGRQRTNTQNAALHQYLKDLATTLNDSGYDVQTALAKAISRPWNQKSCKELLWRPIQEAMIDKTSTAEAERAQYGDIYDVLHRHLATNLGVNVPWPTR